MTYGTECDGDKINVFAVRDESDNFELFFDDSDGESEDSSSENPNSGESSTGSNESSTSNSVAEHDVRPEVPDEFKPNYSMRFKTVDDAIDMYKVYAEKAGFDVRLNTQRKVGNVVKHRYLVCNRMGGGPKTVDISKKRKTSFKVTNCQAKIIIKRVLSTGDYKFDKFQEMHNHLLEDTCDLRSSRQLSFFEKEFIVRASTVKIGATKAHKLRATLRGGYGNVNAKVIDYKNFKRNAGNVIGFKDAQTIVNKMSDRKANYPNYFFEYRCDENNVLNAMFWADETDKAFFIEFGDVVSFDATFRTNKYSLVFVPFTVIDHHRSSVIIGAGLLSTESIDSYKWLLQQFLKCHGKQPVLVLTDQDPALKQAIEYVFPNSKHRLCMWHIMRKLPSKVTAEFLKKNTQFKEKFKKLVWDLHMDIDMFESKWELLIKEHKLEDNRWFSDLYDIRRSWIPAFFKELPMCGLMKTTSRSESMNSFINSYSQSENFLINFMLGFDNAIHKQRNSQRENDRKTRRAQYIMKFPIQMEKHAAAVYTSVIFFGIQNEMKNAAFFCKDKDFSEGEGWELYSIIHNNKKQEFKAVYKVEYKIHEKEIKCSCEYFNRFGVLCRHALRVLMHKNFDEIPEKYVLRRWRKDIISSSYNLGKDRFDDRDADIIQLINQAFLKFESSLDLVRDDKEKLTTFVENLDVLFKDLKKDPSLGASMKDKEIVEKLMSVTIPDEIEIQVPAVQNNKGCGKKRLVGELEKAILNSQKEHRKCSGCGKKEPHNLRTCPVRLAAAAAADKEI